MHAARAPLIAGEKITTIYLWTDSASATVQGIYMITSAKQKLNGAGDRKLSGAGLKADKLASGVLLGITAATRGAEQLLAAISFNFLELPSSSAMAVDMPAINLASLVFTPQVTIKSSTR